MSHSLFKNSLDNAWSDILRDELEESYINNLEKFLEAEKSSNQIIYPSHQNIFRALKETPIGNIRIVILGQDPYHGENQANGLAFSVNRGVRLPPSLRNIYKEIEAEFGKKMPAHGDLGGWTKQGVLLLNATLTVRQSAAGSHQKQGWEKFTDAVIQAINVRCEHVVFMLWGAYAQKKGSFIDRKKHLVIESAHPSPLSAHRGFLGSGQFKIANDYLVKIGKHPVDWTAI